MPSSLSSHPHLWMLQSQGQLCCGEALPAALCSGQLRTEQLGPPPAGIPSTSRMHRIQVTDQTVTSIQIIHYILKSLDTTGPVALFIISSCSCKATQRNQSSQFCRNSLKSLQTSSSICRSDSWNDSYSCGSSTGWKTHILLDFWYSLSCSVEGTVLKRSSSMWSHKHYGLIQECIF